MRRATVVTMLAACTLLLVIPGSAASQAEGLEVIRGSWDCAVGWSEETWATSGSCEVVNVRAMAPVDPRGALPWVGAVDPLAATRTVLEREPAFDEVIVSTLPSGLSRWLELDLPNHIARLTDAPVTTIEAEGTG